MADIYFNCGCGKSLAVDKVGAGQTVQCVDCGQPVQVPSARIEFICAGCGGKLLAASRMGGCHIKCTLCGYRMRLPDIEPEPGVMEKGRTGENHVLPYAKFQTNVLMLTLAVLTLVITGKAVRVLLRPRVMESAPESKTDFQAADMESAPKNTTDFQITDTEPKRRREANGGTGGDEQKIEPSYTVKSEQAAFFEHSHTDEETITEYALFPSGSAPEDELLDAGEKPVVEQEDVASPFEISGNRESSFAKKPAVADMADTEAKDRLMELKKEYKAVEAARRGWHRSGQTPEFRAKVLELQAKAADYTRTRAGMEFAPKEWGWGFFLLLYRDYLILTLQTFDERETAVREMWELLDGVAVRHPTLAARLSLELVFDVACYMAPEYPFECAALWDEEGARLAALNLPEVSRLWHSYSSRTEGWFLKYADKVPEEKRDEFYEQRYDKLMNTIRDESLTLFRRAKILSSWIVYRNAFGRWNDASLAVEKFWNNGDVEMTEHDYYLSRMWVAWYGEGDWEKASGTLRNFTLLVQDGSARISMEDYKNLTDVYYTRIFTPGHELMRQGTKNRESGK